MTRPSPEEEIRETALCSVLGANFWSRRPVTRMDLVVGAYDEISSAEIPGFAAAMLHAMPGLIEHRCSIGERGGFITRLERGTYAPHIVEHVALELQNMVGHDVGYGKTRGGNEPGAYTLVFEHVHAGVGLHAAPLALDAVRRAFAGTLDSVDAALAELREVACTADVAPVIGHVTVAITGGSAREETRALLIRGGLPESEVANVSPARILSGGLPYARSDLAIILDAMPTDVPERYQDSERARQLVSVLCDGASNGGIVVAPAAETEILDYARSRGCRVAVFSLNDGDDRAAEDAIARATVSGGRICITTQDDTVEPIAMRGDAPPVAQVAAALALACRRARTAS